MEGPRFRTWDRMTGLACNATKCPVMMTCFPASDAHIEGDANEPGLVQHDSPCRCVRDAPGTTTVLRPVFSLSSHISAVVLRPLILIAARPAGQQYSPFYIEPVAGERKIGAEAR